MNPVLCLRSLFNTRAKTNTARQMVHNVQFVATVCQHHIWQFRTACFTILTVTHGRFWAFVPFAPGPFLLCNCRKVCEERGDVCWEAFYRVAGASPRGQRLLAAGNHTTFVYLVAHWHCDPDL